MLDRKGIVILVVLSILGLIGNLLKFEMFFNVDFLFGSIFAILAVQLFGFYGVITAFIAGLYTYVLWNHPYAIVIFTAEAVFVAAFRKRSQNIVVVDLMYWLLCGMPLILIFYFIVMKMHIKPTILIMLKQSVNGVFSALVASAIYDALKFLRYIKDKNERVSFQHVVFQLIVFIILVPMVAYVMVSVRSNMHFTSENMRGNFSVLMEATRASVGNYIDDSLLKVDYLEKEAQGSEGNVQVLERELRDIISANREFISLGVLNVNMESILSVNHYGSKVEVRKGENFKDAVPDGVVWRDEEVYISDLQVVDGKKIIYIIKPLFEKTGMLEKFVYTALDFRVIEDVISQMAKNSGVLFSLYDSNGEILLSTGNQDNYISSLSERTDRGMIEVLDDGISIWAPKPSDNVHVMTRWRQSMFTKSAKFSDIMPFTLVADMPMLDHVRHMGESGNRALIVIFVMALLAISLAQIVSGRITRQITLLSTHSKNLPEKISNGEEINWPDTSLSEAQTLKDNFIYMSDQLKERFQQLRRQKEELALLIDHVPLMIIVKDTKNNILKANRVACEYFGKKPDEVYKLPLSEIFTESANYFYERDLKVIKSKLGVFNEITWYRFPEGREMVARVSRIPLFTDDDEVDSILLVIDDITEEIKSSSEREKMLEVVNHQAKMAEMGAMLGTITHQWRQPLNVLSLLAESLKEDIKNEDISKEDILEELDILSQNVVFMNDTIGDFTDFFRKDRVFSTFDINSVVREIYLLIEREFVRQDIRVVIAETGSFKVNSIKSELKQVVLNLLNNAKDALVASGVTDKKIYISYERHEEFGKVIFKDNGGGIEESLLPDGLFEAYVSTKGGAGSGIGLYVCKNIIRDHIGGDLKASNEDGGARFDITLPYDSEY